MTMTAKFSGRCITCNGQITVGQPIDWTKGVGARHIRSTDCQTAPAAPVVRATFEGAGIAAFVLAAKARGLKFPKVRFLHAGIELRISVAGPMSKAPGSLNVILGGEWIGRVRPNGEINGALTARADVLATMQRIAADPVTCAREYGALMGCCSFCNLKLTDAGSVEVGYGPICAKNYGLPHTAKGTPAVSEVAAVEADDDICEHGYAHGCRACDPDGPRSGYAPDGRRDYRRANETFQALRGRML
jgi:hypothetical protein